MKYFLFQSSLLCSLKGPRRTLTMRLTASNRSLTPNNQVLASNNLHLASINLDPASNNLGPASNNLVPASKIQSGRRCWRKDRGITVNELPLIFTIWSRYRIIHKGWDFKDNCTEFILSITSIYDSPQLFLFLRFRFFFFFPQLKNFFLSLTYLKKAIKRSI